MQARDVHDVCLYHSCKTAMPKLQFVNEHAPWAMVKSDPRRAVESARPVQKGLGRREGSQQARRDNIYKRPYSLQEASCTGDRIYKGLAKWGIGSTGGSLHGG